MHWLRRGSRHGGRALETDGAADTHRQQIDGALRVTTLLIGQAQAEIAAQQQASSSKDSQSLAFMAANLASIAVPAALRSSLGSLWWFPSVALGVSAGCFARSVTLTDIQVGPELRAVLRAVEGAGVLDAHLRMLSELLAAIDRNAANPMGDRWSRGGLFAIGIGVLLLLVSVIPSMHVLNQ